MYRFVNGNARCAKVCRLFVQTVFAHGWTDLCSDDLGLEYDCIELRSGVLPDEPQKPGILHTDTHKHLQTM